MYSALVECLFKLFESFYIVALFDRARMTECIHLV